MGSYYKYFGDIIWVDDVDFVGVQFYICGVDNQQLCWVQFMDSDDVVFWCVIVVNYYLVIFWCGGVFFCQQWICVIIVYYVIVNIE